jgi:hypothetical protein
MKFDLYYQLILEKRKKYEDIIYSKSIEFLRFKEGHKSSDDLIKGLAAHLAWLEVEEIKKNEVTK